ncbi:S8 family serine peptidase [Catalinimonas niigatensis]|uniref:S8 family serine peptidase n=1 Tax=Catalinimonas niigatensis TaxID=1397264 RepID=UPI0026659B27|nr:S8 family serine peptidase [Catalinimonas niigatensis]WPP50476.1 S8 family serine peptidase [Catalinimonas niigatensis]
MKVNDKLASRLSSTSHKIVHTNEVSLDQLNRLLNIDEMRRVFPHSGKYESAHQAYGLHQWYEVVFQDTVRQEIEHLVHRYMENEAIQWAEPVYQMSLDVMEVPTEEMNDPRFDEQWHYKNTGQTGGTVGADIQLPEAWNLETGDKSVIVAIIDGGMDITHEDLKDALWSNKTELNGEKGIDDDDNGYIDDVYGYGFGDQRGEFFPHYHGIHVGGTIGAVNNNGKGVAGIAGGLGSADGVRLMSCAVFGRYNQGGFPESFVYAADNGAVIAQNSWGGGAQSKILEDAIDYFIERAGYDNTEENFDKNIQIGPMAGGLVVFAAGNSNSSSPGYGYPASYESCFAVASTDHFDKKSSFSNYGDWIEIAAPGTSVLSTYTNNSYGLLSGTSMACPHVSGVAALIVSAYGKQGFRPEQVKRLLMNSAENIDDNNISYIGQLGAGRLNAFRALYTDDDQVPPAPITDLKIDSLSFESITLSWTASGGDSLSGIAAVYDIRYAQSPISANNFEDATIVADLILPKVAGEKEIFTVHKLPSETRLYWAMKVLDIHGLTSELSNTVDSITTGAPLVKVGPDSLSAELSNGDSLQKELTIDNGEGKSGLTYQLTTITDSLSNLALRENKSSKVLVVQSYPEWNFYMKDFLKSEFDITPDVISHTQLADKDFLGYHLIIVTGGQSSSYINPINAQKDKFETYVKQGGVVQYMITGYYDVYAPAGVWINNGYSNSLNQKITNHQITRDIPETINSSSASSGRIENLPENSTVLTIYGSNQTPTTAIYPLGKGEIILSCMYWERFYKNQEKDIHTFLFNATEYALYASKSHQWLTYPASGFVPAGSSVKVPIVFQPKGLFSGIYQQQLVVSSNDPENPKTKIPVTLKVNASPILKPSKDSLNFDSLYIGLSSTDTLWISNQGTDTLKVTSVTSNLSDYQVGSTVFLLAPYEKYQILVSFTPDQAGSRNALLTLKSNLPDYQIKLFGQGIDSPVLQLPADTIKVKLLSGQKTQRILPLSNKGGSDLNWHTSITYTKFNPLNSKNEDNDYSLGKAESFVVKPFPANTILSTLIAASDDGYIFAKQANSSAFYKYDVGPGRWERVADAPIAGYSTYNNGVYLLGKVYFIYRQIKDYLGVYDIEKNHWSSIDISSANTTPSQIASDGSYLYILYYNGVLKRFDTTNAQWHTLTRNFEGNNAYIGMSYSNGKLYVHTNNLFFSYNLLNEEWKKLETPPQAINSSSTIEPYGQIIYFTSGPSMSLYDIRQNKWYVTRNPLINTNNFTHFTYLGMDDHTGIYFSNSQTFGQYITRPYLQWLEPELRRGKIISSDSMGLSLEIDADALEEGEYAALIHVNSNDPVNPIINVPVMLNVYSEQADENEPPVVANSLNQQELHLRNEPYTFNLVKYFSDPEGYPLTFYASSRNVDMAVTNIQGSLLEILTVDTGEVTLDLIAEDILGKKIEYYLKLSIADREEDFIEVPEAPSDNQAPLAKFASLHYSLELHEQLNIYLDSLFSDPDNDILTYTIPGTDESFSLQDSTSHFKMIGNTLSLEAIAMGTSNTILTAYDPEGNSAQTIIYIAVNPALKLKGELENVLLQKGRTHSVDLHKVIENSTEQKLFFNSFEEDSSIVSTSIRDYKLLIQAKNIGETKVYLEIANERGKVLPMNFVVVVNALLSTEEELSREQGLLCYPNPTYLGTHLQYNLWKKEHVWLGVYSSSGQLISVLADEMQNTGEHHFYWDTRSISAGTYIIRLITSAGVDNVKMLVLPEK